MDSVSRPTSRATGLNQASAVLTWTEPLTTRTPPVETTASVAPRITGVITLAMAKTVAQGRHAARTTSWYARKIKAEPRSTMPSSTR